MTLPLALGASTNGRRTAMPPSEAPDLASRRRLRVRQHPYTGQALKQQLADGKWRTLSSIAHKIDRDERRVRDALYRMLKNRAHGCKAERKKVGQHFEYRIFRQDKGVSSLELTEKLTPILKGLEAEGAKNMATMSPGTVAYLAGQLRRLLEEWTE
jgi:hypothetical protein